MTLGSTKEQQLRQKLTGCISSAPGRCTWTSGSGGRPPAPKEPWRCPWWSRPRSGCPGRRAPCPACTGNRSRPRAEAEVRRTPTAAEPLLIPIDLRSGVPGWTKVSLWRAKRDKRPSTQRLTHTYRRWVARQLRVQLGCRHREKQSELCSKAPSRNSTFDLVAVRKHGEPLPI